MHEYSRKHSCSFRGRFSLYLQWCSTFLFAPRLTLDLADRTDGYNALNGTKWTEIVLRNDPRLRCGFPLFAQDRGGFAMFLRRCVYLQKSSIQLISDHNISYLRDTFIITSEGIRPWNFVFKLRRELVPGALSPLISLSSCGVGPILDVRTTLISSQHQHHRLGKRSPEKNITHHHQLELVTLMSTHCDIFDVLLIDRMWTLNARI